MNKIWTIFLVYLLKCYDAASLLTVNLDSGNNEVSVCPGDQLAIVCYHNNTGDGVTRWEATGTEVCLVSHDPPPESGTMSCGDFTIRDISTNSGATLNSTAVTVADSNIDGVTVECRAGSASTSSLVGNVTIRVLSIPTPTINTIQQLTRSTVTLTLEADNRCVGSYKVRALADGGPTANYTSALPVVSARGLDVCRYNYSFVASVLTPGLVQGEESNSTDLIADLSVIDAPVLSAPSFSLDNNSIILNITILNPNVPGGSYQYTTSSGENSPVLSLSGRYFDIELPRNASERGVGVMVIFQEYQCTQNSFFVFSLPSLEISGVEETASTATSHTVKISLPLTSYESNELLIISTVSPPDVEPITAAYTGPGQQYTVTFDGLQPNTSYSFTIGIVLSAADNTVVSSVTGEFMTVFGTPDSTDDPTSSLPQGGCTGGCVTGIVVAIIILLLLLITGIILLLFFLVRHQSSNNQTKNIQMKKKHEVEPPGVDIEVS